MTVEKIISYLKVNSSSPSLNFTWTDQDNKNFFIFLEENTDGDYLKKKNNLLDIKQAFIEYLGTIGYILFQIRNYKIRLKVFPYSTLPEDSLHIETIVDVINANRHLIINDYNGRENQIYIENELKEKICTYVGTIENEKVNKKDLFKYAVREAFKLKQEDIVILKKDSIFIKLCDISRNNSIENSEQYVKDNRFNGIDEEELNEFNREHFSNKENKEFFDLAAKLFVNKYFNEKNINNHEYEKNVFAYIQLIITEQLMNTFDHCEDFFKGFSGYIFRRNFQEVFDHIAELILVEVAMSNKYMIDFLKYYSLNIVVIGGNRYQVPALEADNGLRWNVVSMMSIVKLYVRTNSISKAMGSALDKKNVELMSLAIDGLSPVEYNTKQIDEKNKLLNLLIKYEDDLEKCKDSLSLAKNETRKLELREEMKFIKENMQKVKEENKKLLKKVVKREDINKFIALDKEIASMHRALKREDKILSQNIEAFNSIQNALVKALISKKKKL